MAGFFRVGLAFVGSKGIPLQRHLTGRENVSDFFLFLEDMRASASPGSYLPLPACKVTPPGLFRHFKNSIRMRHHEESNHPAAAPGIWSRLEAEDGAMPHLYRVEAILASLKMSLNSLNFESLSAPLQHLVVLCETEAHHDFAMFTVSGNGIARQVYKDMPRFVGFDEAVKRIEDAFNLFKQKQIATQ